MTTRQETSSWHQTAVNARLSLRLLGHPILMDDCLPGEANAGACGGTDAQHALAYFAALMAVVDHYLSHVTDEQTKAALQEVYTESHLAMIDNCKSTC